MILIYTLPNCSQCKLTKEYLTENKVEWSGIDMSKGGDKDTIEMKKKFKEMGIKNYPVIVWNSGNDNEMIVSGFDKEMIDSLIK